MNIVVVVRQVPDLAEELEPDDTGKALDRTFLTYVLNEFDDHALEEALLLKEELGGTVTVLAPAGEGADDALFTALAKGADRAALVEVGEGELTSHALAAAYGAALAGESFDVVLTGVQSVEDRDGQLGPLLAARLGLPHVSVVTHVRLDPGARTATVNQEYAGGVVAEFEVDLPAVLGVQAARATPRYAPLAKVRQLSKTVTLETLAGGAGTAERLEVRRLWKPEAARHAEMLEGEPQEVADRLVSIFTERGLLKGAQ